MIFELCYIEAIIVIKHLRRNAKVLYRGTLGRSIV